MVDLNNLEELRKLDPQNTIDSTGLLPKQMSAAWEEVNSLEFPQASGVKSIVFCGMGASIYGALVIKALLGPKFPVPTEMVSDYHLPDFVDSHTLIVLTSYSGSTEEVLSCASEAKAKRAQMIVLSKGGKLGDFARENNIPAYLFDGKLNPAGIPRLGIGYSVIGLMGLLHKTGAVNFETSILESALASLPQKIENLEKITKDHANTYQGFIPVIFAAEHLAGNAQILRNQFNETSKTFSAHYLIPDLNHHLMEGLQFPKDAKLRFLVFQSSNYSAKNSKRTDLTIEVTKQNKREVDVYKTSGKNIFEDFLEVLMHGSYLTLWLGLLNEQNPSVNPWVDYFKDQLGKVS